MKIDCKLRAGWRLPSELRRAFPVKLALRAGSASSSGGSDVAVYASCFTFHSVKSQQFDRGVVSEAIDIINVIVVLDIVPIASADPVGGSRHSGRDLHVEHDCLIGVDDLLVLACGEWE